MTLMTPSYAPPLSFHLPRIDIRNLGGMHEDEDFVRLFIAQQFEMQRIGKVSRVDLIAKENEHGYLYYEAFVHFERWNDASSHSLALRNAACSPWKRATLGLIGTGYHWIVNESRSPVYEEDWDSILSVLPAGKWTQAGDEAELVEYQKKRAEATLIKRWYKHVPTDEQLSAVAALERFASKYCRPRPITCPEVCQLFAAQAQYEYDQALAVVARAEAELKEAEGNGNGHAQFLAGGGWGDRCVE